MLGAALALVATGCGEDVQQRASRVLLEQHLADDPRYAGDAHCTDAAKDGWVARRRTEDFVCAIRRAGGGCDWWRVTLLAADRARFAIDRRDAGCILPA